MIVSSIRGVVIKENFSGDSDKYIVIFAKNIGKISVFAKGARKLKSKFLPYLPMGILLLKKAEENIILIRLILLRIFMD
jgi:DNA repair protein RecO